MKKVLISFICLCTIGIGSVAISQDVDKGPENITLQTEKAKKPAKFPHFKHQNVLTCDDCHKNLDAEMMATNKNYAHKEGCKNCHKEKGIKAKCTTCHGKKKVVIEGC